FRSPPPSSPGRGARGTFRSGESWRFLSIFSCRSRSSAVPAVHGPRLRPPHHLPSGPPRHILFAGRGKFPWPTFVGKFCISAAAVIIPPDARGVYRLGPAWPCAFPNDIIGHGGDADEKAIRGQRPGPGRRRARVPAPDRRGRGPGGAGRNVPRRLRSEEHT